MEEAAAQQLWDQWALFASTKSIRGLVFEKQIGLMSDSQPFSHRSKWQDPPGIVNIFESILTGIETRFKKGLYKNKFVYLTDIQIMLQECLKTYRDHKDVIVDSFQNKTLLTISKEKEPKVVASCERCKNYALINIHCPKCLCVFYCDQACLKGHAPEHLKVCSSLIQNIPNILETLQVEMHSYSENQNITLYFEHEMKFSLRTRGIKLFAEIKNKLLTNKLMKWRNYSVKEFKNSLVLTLEPQQQTHSAQKAVGTADEILAQAASLPTEAKQGEEAKKEEKVEEKSPTKDVKDKKPITTDPNLNAKMPAVQEVKMMLLEMGGVIVDVIQEKHPQKITFVHIFLLP